MKFPKKFKTTEFVNPPSHDYGRRAADYPPSREATARRRGLNGFGTGVELANYENKDNDECLMTKE